MEGPEGAGKSTVARSLAAKIEEQGNRVVLTREPGDGPAGPAIRSALLQGATLDAWTELFLFLADRSQHCASLIIPKLAEGNWVLCDRFADSTVVYQGYGRGLDLDQIRKLNEIATQRVSPDLTLLLDLPAEVGLSRLREKDRIDREPIEFHHRIRQGFLDEANRDSARWRVVDATRSAEEVLEECWQAVQALFALGRK